MLVLAACGGDDSPTSPNGGNTPVDSTFTAVRSIVVARCAISACHGTGSIQGGLTFGGASYSQVRNASGDHGAVVNVGSSATSNLYLKVTPTPPFGDRMPRTGGFLSASQQETIRKWIDQGALNN